MPKQTLEVADIFRARGPVWRQANASLTSMAENGHE